MSDNSMDHIVDELVVFGNGHGGFISNSPFWHDSRIQARWIEKYAAGEEKTAGVDADGDGEPDVNYGDWTNEELRTELARRGLPVAGKKEELVARLDEDDEADEDEDED